MCKRFLAYLVAVSAVLVLLFVGAPAANAQSGQVKVVVPFDFVAGANALPAGVYYATQDSASRPVIQLGNSTHAITLLSNVPALASGKPDEPSRLVFQRYGQHYFLREVWFHQGNTGCGFAQTPAERIIAEEYRVASQRERVSIVASVR